MNGYSQRGKRISYGCRLLAAGPFDLKLPVLIAVRLLYEVNTIVYWKTVRTLAKSTPMPDAYHITFLVVRCDVMSVFNPGYTFVLNAEALKTFT